MTCYRTLNLVLFAKRTAIKQVLVVTLCVWFSPTFANNESLRHNIYGSGEWVPYVFPQTAANATKPGIVAEIVTAVLAHASIQGESIQLPPERTNQSLKFGIELDMDIISPAWFKEGKPPFGQLTEPFMTIAEYVVTTPEQEHSFQRLEDLYAPHKLVGVVRGYYYFDSDKFNRIDFPSERQLIQGLALGRIDAIIMGEATARYFANIYNIDVSLAALHAKGNLSMRISEQKAHLIPALNSAIDELKRNGTVAKIIGSYSHDKRIVD